MFMRLFVVLGVLAGLSSSALCGGLLSEDWESSPLGALTLPWRAVSNNQTTSATIVSVYNGNTTKMLKLSDTNVDTAGNHVYNKFQSCTYGTVTLQFDVCLSTIHAGYGMRITTGGTPTYGGSWCAGIKFEGDVPYAPGAAAGDISYQVLQTGTDAYVVTNPKSRYSADTWYTLRIAANLDTRKCDIFFGPRNGSIALITPTGGVDFIRSSTGAQASSAGGLSFFTSQKVEEAGNAYLDNIVVTWNVEHPATVAEAKQLTLGSIVLLDDQTVTAGTDQTNRPFFYIQDSTAGIRVRSSAMVRQGDKVSLRGSIRRACDSGAIVLRSGELEIDATSVAITYGPFPMCKPVGMNNKSVGGGPKGPSMADGFPAQPGVWARSTGATSGYDQIDEPGLNNIGRLGRVYGKVTYADDANRFFYIDDGSGVRDGAALADGSPSPKGVRVLVPPGIPLTGIVGKYARVTGVLGSVAASEAGSPKGIGGDYIRNIRVIRATPEPFLDLNQNGFWDAGERFIDTNGNGACDGIEIPGVVGPDFVSRFDRYGTLILRGAPFMPRGLYAYDVSFDTLAAAKNQGFNTVMCFDAMGPSDLATFNALGLKTFPTLHNPANRPAWMAVRTDPAIAAWYLNDEPEWHGEDPAANLASYNWVHSQDGTHPVGNSHADVNRFGDYAASDDMCWIDRYPVGNTSSQYCIPSIASFADVAHAVHGGDVYYPAWQFVQMFKEVPNFTMPTVAQFRAMIYTAMSHHVKGYFYFSYQRGAEDWQALWAEAANVNGEMETLRSFFLLPWVPLDVTCSNPTWVMAGGYRIGNSALIIVVNADKDAPQSATITLPGIPDNTTLTAPIGGQGQTLTGRSFTYTFAPCEVRVLLWGSIPTPP